MIQQKASEDKPKYNNWQTLHFSNLLVATEFVILT